MSAWASGVPVPLSPRPAKRKRRGTISYTEPASGGTVADTSIRLLRERFRDTHGLLVGHPVLLPPEAPLT